MSDLSIHDVTEIKSKIKHYTKDLDFYVREITIKTSDDDHVTLKLFSDNKNDLLFK